MSRKFGFRGLEAALLVILIGSFAGVTLYCAYPAIAQALVPNSMYLHNAGRIHAIGVRFYTDALCTQPASSIQWGDVLLGSNNTALLYAKNVETVSETLSFAVANWNPLAASQYLVAGWNYSDATLSPSQIVPINFTLYVNASCINIDTFSFDYFITASP